MKEQDEFADKIGLSPGALMEILDCIERRSTLQYIRKTMRTVYGTTLTNEQWAAIKEWAAQRGAE
ncbi:MAG TPA: hypothetical protein VFB79_15935 [Candidatus Angelobacter sp.]|nr:hypothetical protein [Candidatus Angelobacter sp.]